MTIKEQLKKCFITNKRLGVSLVLASLYIGFALTLNFFSQIEDMKWYPLIVAIVLALLVVTVCAIGEGRIVSALVSGVDTPSIWRMSFFIVFVGQLLYLAAYYPGGFNLDAYGQWDQIHGFVQWDNWHPVLTTMIYWLLTRIVDSVGFCVFVQMLFFSLAVASLMKALAEAGISKGIIVVLVVVVALDPSIGMNNVCLVKDVFFAIGVIVLSSAMIKMYVSCGDWINDWKNTLILILISAFIVLVRHNGVIYIIPAFLMMFIHYKDCLKRLMIAMISVIMIVIVFEAASIGAMNVRKHSNFIGEIVGVPMAAMANAYVNNYDNTPQDVKQYFESIADRESWNKLYVIGEWDSCKWDFGGIELLQGEKISIITNMFFETCRSCPQEVFQSIRENTRIVWQLIGRIDWVPWIYIETPNDYSITENSIPAAKIIVKQVEEMSYHPIAAFFIWNVGVKTIGLLLLGLLSVKDEDWKKLLLLIPVFCYVFGTMVLLSGPTYRYFYFVSVLVGPYLAFMILGKEGVDS